MKLGKYYARKNKQREHIVKKITQLKWPKYEKTEIPKWNEPNIQFEDQLKPWSLAYYGHVITLSSQNPLCMQARTPLLVVTPMVMKNMVIKNRVMEKLTL